MLAATFLGYCRTFYSFHECGLPAITLLKCHLLFHSARMLAILGPCALVVQQQQQASWPILTAIVSTCERRQLSQEMVRSVQLFIQFSCCWSPASVVADVYQYFGEAHSRRHIQASRDCCPVSKTKTNNNNKRTTNSCAVTTGCVMLLL